MVAEAVNCQGALMRITSVEPMVLGTAWRNLADGYFALPAGPGLGVTLDSDLIARHPRRPLFLDLYKEGWQLRQADLEARAGRGRE